ncbi:MAG TPA: flagellar biosynthesis protein FlhF [bacterium]|nr:flagellar biosynthesis protein FlhF [bacterium]
MRVKKFTAPTISEAMRLVKNELGEDAIIVHTREHRKPILGLFGRPFVEVTAGTGLGSGKSAGTTKKSPETPVPVAPPPPIMPPPASANRVDRVDLSPHAIQSRTASSELKELARSVLAQAGQSPEKPSEESIRRDTQDASVMLDKRLASLEEQMIRLSGLIERAAVPAPCTESAPVISNPWKDYLLTQEIEESLADEILDAVDGKVTRRTIREEIIRRLTVTGPILADEVKSGTKVVMLVGPTGVGKTTTLAKIAPGFTHPTNGTRRSAVFMTADLFRIAAVEQLQKYSEILRVPLEVVYSPEEAAAAIQRHQDADLILVDTGGTGQRNESQISNLAAIAKACQPVEVHLVVAATTKSCDLRDIVERFQELGPQRLLVTKLDESTAFGNILNAVVASGLPVSYMTTGQMVPEDIEVATSERLADLILGTGGPQEVPEPVKTLHLNPQDFSEEEFIPIAEQVTERIALAGGVRNA